MWLMSMTFTAISIPVSESWQTNTYTHTQRIEEVRRHHVKNHIHTHVQHVLASIRPIIRAEGLILHAACKLLEILG